MSFKKSKIKSENVWLDILNKINTIQNSYKTIKRKNLISWVFLWVIWLSVVIWLAIVTFSVVWNFKIDLSFLKSINITWLSTNDPTKEKINILLTWVWWWVHQWTDLTDTIILASINTKKKIVTMLSLPRDLYVSYPTWWAWRINELYTRWLKNLSESKSMSFLKDKITEITWENIDYYVNIDFEWFVKFVDLIDWIKVDVPSDLTDTDYPDDNWWYETFSVKKWVQNMNGQTALKYARSRHSTSDFDRSLRQQLVIKAIKDKLFKLEYIWNPLKIKSLFYAISSNLKTDLSLTDIISLAFLGKNIPNENIYSFNLNTSCYDNINLCEKWWFLYYWDRSAFWWASVILPEWATPKNLSEYKEINKFSNLIFNYPEVIKEKNEINIVNSTKVSWLANKLAVELKKYWFNVPDKNSIFSSKDNFEKSQINFLWDEQNKTGIAPENKTLEALSQFVFAEQKATPGFKYSSNPGWKIELIIGDDYKLFFK